MEYKQTCAIDLDDVCWNFTSTWLDFFNRIYDTNYHPEEIKEWDLSEYINEEHLEKLYKVVTSPMFWCEVQPYKTSQMYLKKFSQDYDLYIVTASGFAGIEAKISHFFRLFPFIKEEKIIIAKDKHLIKTDILIDDNPLNLVKGDYYKILINKPWNINYSFDSDDVVRLDDLETAYKYLSMLQKG